MQLNPKHIVFRLVALLLGSTSLPLQAHNPLQSDGATFWAALVAVLLLALFWLFYVVGSIKRPPQRWRALLFHSSCVLCAIAVIGPLDELAETSASAHMIQHMLFMVVITPMWALSMPLAQFAAASGHWGRLVWQPLLKLTAFPLSLAYLHAAMVWFWHTPRFYVLALEHPWWHLVEHFCFIFSAVILWWAVLNCSERSRSWALLALLFTLMHTGFLGALLTFADTLLYYPEHQLADQQLAGLLMWVPGGLPYLLAAAWLGYRWLTGRAVNTDPTL
ncbi:Cytochrome c oxidase assembly factor CtaG [Arsukibacterium tuosuense]|uniref:Cytochrome c oxidase assembly factor CtaG n=1 Tax=Arsukibacterium tuosuense TaxID=1323745 RepID=A0A285I7Q1_9GAMM|nr:cytochrome c oxidase assembly protein [Arsukibacterium tuosuense]SNY43913.1 Cytochrome c oxidase assembly factor CtaG [Arsukibacterium tuosuense]